MLSPKAGGVYVDGTFGAGGYTKSILECGVAKVYAFDRDPDAVKEGEALVASSGGRLTLVPERFSRMRQALADRGVDQVDGVTLDIGVSSMQLDRPGRGYGDDYSPWLVRGPVGKFVRVRGRAVTDEGILAA